MWLTTCILAEADITSWTVHVALGELDSDGQAHGLYLGVVVIVTKNDLWSLYHMNVRSLLNSALTVLD